MQVADSVRYREAVTRLKRLLYDQPGWECVPPHTSCHHPQQDSRTHAAHINHLSYQATVRSDGGGVGGVSPQVGREEAASRWLLELLRHQEELITQLERENDFLKREVVSVGEGVRRMGQENQELNRRLADALSQAIAMGEASEASISSSSTESGKKDATNSTIATLKREKATLQEEVSRLQDSLSAMTQREQEALSKLRQALTLAEDTHTHTAQVRASSESALKELSTLLAATKQEGQELRRLLEEADNKQKRKQEQKDEQVAKQQQRIKALQEEREEQEQAMTGLRQEMRESSRKVTALEEDLLAARAARTRLEVQLEEQRQHSRDAHARLDQIIVARSGEAAAGTARAQELEDRLTAAREDTSRLLHAITTLAQGSGRGMEADTTDDVKSERLAAGQQLGAAITAIQARHESEVRSLREAAQQQSEAMDRLREEVARMRQQLASDNESYRKTRAQHEDDVARVLEELQQARQEVFVSQEQARVQGALYQRALDQLKQSQGKTTRAEHQSSKYLELVGAVTRERDALRREMTYLRRVAATCDPASTVKCASGVPMDHDTSPPSDAAPAGTPEDYRDQGPNHLAEEHGPGHGQTTPALLASDAVFRDVTVAPGLTLLHLYQ